MERTVPFGLICFSVVTLWYALHGHAPADVASHRAGARWYTTKTEPSYDDMTIKLRRVIIAARFHSPCLSRPPRKKPRPSSQPGAPPGHDQQNLRNTRPCSPTGRPPGRWSGRISRNSVGSPGSGASPRADVARQLLEITENGSRVGRTVVLHVRS